MLSGQGWTAVAGCRQFFYARYLDWMITFPLITILLGQIAGCEWTVIFGAIGSQRAFPWPSFPLPCRAANILTLPFCVTWQLSNSLRSTWALSRL